MKPPAARPWAGSPFRRRRILWSLSLLTLASIYYLTRHGAPSLLSLAPSLKDLGLDVGFAPDSSRPGRVAQALARPALAGKGAYADVREVDALVHFLTAHPARKLDEDTDMIRVEGLGSVRVEPGEPVDLRVYAPDGQYGWEEHVRRVHAQFPLVVFSKTYCPYSQRAKALLEEYDIEPKPKIIELNVRSDGPQLQAILARLTGRKTVPNILLKGNSLGGSDDIQMLHEEGRLRKILEDGGLNVKGEPSSSTQE